VEAGPFEPLNCGAIPRELAESELLGHAAGAFTGASGRRRGAFERAHGGTLFLDEIGEMSLELQPKLLRVLEDGTVRRLGDGRHRQVQARIVAATNSSLSQRAGLGHFRMDLYHRLAVAVIQLPPLRERAADIPMLVRAFLDQCAGSGPSYTVDDRALELLGRRRWPGNVRELRNAVLRATMEGGRQLVAEDFSFLSDQEGAAGPGGAGWVQFLGRPFDELRREVYLRVLEQHGGNRSAAAAALAIAKSTFFDQLRAMDL
jgi:DNA-binding NtrC family response regulator